MAAKVDNETNKDDNRGNENSKSNTSSSEQTSVQANQEPEKLNEVIDIQPTKRNKSESSDEQRLSTNELEGMLKNVPVECLKLPDLSTKSKSTTEVREQADIEQNQNATFTKDDFNPHKHFGRKMWNFLTNVFSKRKRSSDVELGEEEPGPSEVTQKDEDCVDKAKQQEVDEAPILTESVSGEFEKAKEHAEDENQEEAKVPPASIPWVWYPLETIPCTRMPKSYLWFIGAILGVIILALLCIGVRPRPESLREVPLRQGRYIEVVTGCGMVEGVKESDVYAFRGIPYAQAPVGELRWRAAHQIQSIENCWNGTWQAHNSSIICSQLSSAGAIVGQEDCLYLDIVTPHVRYDNLRPVIVLIGANSLNGPSPGILQPPLHYAQKHDVVFVRPNFRLGAFGFLSVEALTKDAYPRTSGNYALSDILAVLRWIKLNIYHFGGNPRSVTLLGHRAGGTLVSALMFSKAAEGLFTRAWTTSSAAVFPGKPLQESEKLNQEIMHAIDCDSVACMRTAPPKQIWAATPDAWLHFPTDLPTKAESTARHHEWLVLDGSILQHHPSKIWKKERSGGPTLVMGTTAHTSHTAKLRELHLHWTRDEVRDFIASSQLGALNLTEEIMNLYKVSGYNDLIAIISDIRTTCPLLINARQQPTVPFYVVTQRKGVDRLAMVNADIMAILGQYKAHTSDQRIYVAIMEKLFYDYVLHGIVPSFDSRHRAFTVSNQAEMFRSSDHCDFWISKDIVPRYARID